MDKREIVARLVAGEASHPAHTGLHGAFDLNVYLKVADAIIEATPERGVSDPTPAPLDDEVEIAIQNIEWLISQNRWWYDTRNKPSKEMATGDAISTIRAALVKRVAVPKSVFDYVKDGWYDGDFGPDSILGDGSFREQVRDWLDSVEREG